MSIEKLEALNKARTQGLWESPKRYPAVICAEVNDDPMQIVATLGEKIDENSEFIVAMANCADEILAVLREARGLSDYWGKTSRAKQLLDALEAKIAKECGE